MYANHVYVWMLHMVILCWDLWIRNSCCPGRRNLGIRRTGLHFRGLQLATIPRCVSILLWHIFHATLYALAAALVHHKHSQYPYSTFWIEVIHPPAVRSRKRLLSYVRRHRISVLVMMQACMRAYWNRHSGTKNLKEACGCSYITYAKLETTITTGSCTTIFV